MYAMHWLYDNLLLEFGVGLLLLCCDQQFSSNQLMMDGWHAWLIHSTCIFKAAAYPVVLLLISGSQPL
ncbi:hypothetical protein K1719_023602 [Acacia pycnantha]|nr:hypothetical protein K1719_023602 [Acacia pycnantha]